MCVPQISLFVGYNIHKDPSKDLCPMFKIYVYCTSFEIIHFGYKSFSLITKMLKFLLWASNIY